METTSVSQELSPQSNRRQTGFPARKLSPQRKRRRTGFPARDMLLSIGAGGLISLITTGVLIGVMLTLEEDPPEPVLSSQSFASVQSGSTSINGVTFLQIQVNQSVCVAVVPAGMIAPEKGDSIEVQLVSFEEKPSQNFYIVTKLLE